MGDSAMIARDIATINELTKKLAEAHNALILVRATLEELEGFEAVHQAILKIDTILDDHGK